MDSKSKISVTAAVFMNINMMIGAGIFIFPTLMTQEASNYSYLGWVLVAIIFLPIVFTIAKISQFYPGEGSFYNYSKNTLGRTTGFLSGWFYILAYTAVAALHLRTINVILGKELGISFIENNPFQFFTLFISLFAIISLFKLESISKLLTFGTIFKLLPIFIVIGALILMLFSDSNNTVNVISSEINTKAVSGFSFSNLLQTIPYALFGYWGFEACATVGHRIKGNKPSNVSKSVFIAFIATVFIYVTFHVGITKIMGIDSLSKLGVRAFPKFLPYSSPTISKFISALMKSSITMAHISVFFGTLISCSSLLKSMAKNRLIFFSDLLSKENKSSQPHYAIIFQALIVLAITTLIPQVEQLTVIANLGLLFTLLTTTASLFIICRNRQYNFLTIVPILSVSSCLVLGYYSWTKVGEIMNIIPFISLGIIGIIIYLTQAKSSKSEDYEITPSPAEELDN